MDWIFTIAVKVSLLYLNTNINKRTCLSNRNCNVTFLVPSSTKLWKYLVQTRIKIKFISTWYFFILEILKNQVKIHRRRIVLSYVKLWDFSVTFKAFRFWYSQKFCFLAWNWINVRILQHSYLAVTPFSRVTRKFRPIHQVTSWHICHLTHPWKVILYKSCDVFRKLRFGSVGTSLVIFL